MIRLFDIFPSPAIFLEILLPFGKYHGIIDLQSYPAGKDPDMKQTVDYLNAYTFGFCEKRGFTQNPAWKASLEEMVRTTGCNAVILPVCAWQDHAFSTEMDSDTPAVMSAEDVRAVCGHARSLGLKIILKAMVNCRDGYWRAYIRFFDTPVPCEPKWEDWFRSWGRHVCLVADMAEENKADLYCIGCEMVGTDHRADEWRALAEEVRKHYSGPITYNCDKYQEDNVTWWDAVDMISSSGYYPIDRLDENFERIRAVAERFGKPFLFMECGCPAREGSEFIPNNWAFGGETSPSAQERWYRAFTDALLRYPFVRGTGWWDWPASRLYPEKDGMTNSGYCTYGKPAGDVLFRFADALKK